MRSAIAVTIALLAAAHPLAAAELRIVAASPTLAEIVCALHAGSKLVGVADQTTLPAELAEIPTIGHERALAPEGILALEPDLLLVTENAGPSLALSQLEAIGVRVEVIPSVRSVRDARERIVQVAKLVATQDGSSTDRAVIDPIVSASRDGLAGGGTKSRADSVLAEFDREIELARETVARDPKRPRVLFLYARGGSQLLVSGGGTAAASMIDLAGGVNAITGFDDYRPLTAESLVEASPDVILMTRAGAGSVGGSEAVWEIPGMDQTPAGRTHALVVMEDVHLLGFGPRLGSAISELAEGLHAWNP